MFWSCYLNRWFCKFWIYFSKCCQPIGSWSALAKSTSFKMYTGESFKRNKTWEKAQRIKKKMLWAWLMIYGSILHKQIILLNKEKLRRGEGKDQKIMSLASWFIWEMSSFLFSVFSKVESAKIICNSSEPQLIHEWYLKSIESSNIVDKRWKGRLSGSSAIREIAEIFLPPLPAFPYPIFVIFNIYIQTQWKILPTINICTAPHTWYLSFHLHWQDFNPKFCTQKQWKTPQNNPAQVKYTVFAAHTYFHTNIASNKYQVAVFQIAPSPLSKSPFSLLPFPQIALCSPDCPLLPGIFMFPPTPSPSWPAPLPDLHKHKNGMIYWDWIWELKSQTRKWMSH